MSIKTLLEDLSNYEDIQPTARQKEIAEKVKVLFEQILKEAGLNNEIVVAERTCLKQDLGEDFPEVNVDVRTEDGEDSFFESYIYMSGDEETIKSDLEHCPISISLVSDVFALDEFYPCDEAGASVETALKGLENRIRAELNLDK